MQDGHDSTLTGCICDLGSKNVAFCESHRSSVFHRTCVKFRNKELVVLLEWVGNAKLRFKENESLLCLIKNVFGIQVLKK